MFHHGTALWYKNLGLLLQGEPGSGKSDLALRLIQAGGTLVADDQVFLTFRQGRLIAQRPEALKDMLEVRGLGILKVPSVAWCFMDYVVQLRPADQIPRLPLQPLTFDLMGQRVPSFYLDPTVSSSLARLDLWLQQEQKDALEPVASLVA